MGTKELLTWLARCHWHRGMSRSACPANHQCMAGKICAESTKDARTKGLEIRKIQKNIEKDADVGGCISMRRYLWWWPYGGDAVWRNDLNEGERGNRRVYSHSLWISPSYLATYLYEFSGCTHLPDGKERVLVSSPYYGTKYSAIQFLSV